MQLPSSPPPPCCHPPVCLHTRTWLRKKGLRKLVAYRLLRRGTSNPTSCTCHAPLSLLPCSCPLAFHTFAYHLRGLAEQEKEGRGAVLLIAATLAASQSSCLATCNSRSSGSSSSGSNGGPSRFRCLGTTRLLEEVASCQGRGGRGSKGS